ncbi:unnamed protein product, partial [Ectocarpus sp. 13 AM-2016]
GAPFQPQHRQALHLRQQALVHQRGATLKVKFRAGDIGLRERRRRFRKVGDESSNVIATPRAKTGFM